MNFNEIGKAYNLINLFDDSTEEEIELFDILYDISTKIYDYRINNNLTQQQLAKRLGIRQAMVSKLESGEYNPTIEFLWNIALKLGVNFDININPRKSVIPCVTESIITFSDIILLNIILYQKTYQYQKFLRLKPRQWKFLIIIL
jgi:transcriptional regulator with XRE-family HTH domain